MHYMYLCCRLPISNVQVQFFFVPTTVNVRMYSFLLACTSSYLLLRFPPLNKDSRERKKKGERKRRGRGEKKREGKQRGGGGKGKGP